MWKSFSIGKKIWVSLSILILGYFLSMVFGFITGKNAESSLFYVSECIFPASKHSQQALTAFDEQIKLYKDAVVLGEAEAVVSAEAKAEEAKTALQQIAALKGLKGAQKNEVEDTLKKLSDFTNSANRVYSFMSPVLEGEEQVTPVTGESFNYKVSSLASKTDELKNRLSSLARTFSDELTGELSSVSNATKQQRYWNMIIFFCVVIFSGALIWIIISRFITKPMGHGQYSLGYFH